jgi:hypothetical protein
MASHTRLASETPVRVKSLTPPPCHSPPRQVEERLAELGNLLPDIVGKLDRARADVLYELLKDPAATAQRLLALRELLPRCNVSALVAGHPKLMLGLTVSCCSSSKQQSSSAAGWRQV